MSDGEEVRLRIGGTDYGGWTSVEVERSWGQAAASFQLEVSEAGNPGEAWKVREDDACQVLYGGLVVVTGHIDVRSPSFDATSHSVSLAGRSKTADLVDSSAIIPGGEVNGYTLDAVARSLSDPHGIEVATDGPVGEALKGVRLQQGETSWSLIERLARVRAISPHDDEDGNLVLKAFKASAPVATLREGDNILSASAEIRSDKRHSDYTVKGQSVPTDEAWGRDAAGIVASAKDGAVKRHRPLLVVMEEPGDVKSARERADYEATVRAGEAVSVEVVVWGWNRSGGLWKPGDMVRFASPTLAVNRNLAVEGVRFRKSDSDGTTATLRLVPPEALSTEAGGGEPGENTDAAWSAVKPKEKAA